MRKVLLLIILFYYGVSCGQTAIYTVSSTSAVASSGIIPTGSSATYSQTFTTTSQITNGNSAILTLSGYAGYTITSIGLNMRSNASAGTGGLTVVAGSTSIFSIASGTAFNNAAWNGSYTTTYTNIPAKTPSVYAITTGQNVVITIAASVNSLYIASYSITYTATASVPTLTTPTVSAINTLTATLGATVTADGGTAISSRGTVWGTSATPTVNLLAEGGTTVTAFSHARSGFAPNTVYFYRGYAINTNGTGYSPDGTFTTIHNSPNVGSGSGATQTSIVANWTAPSSGGSAAFTYEVQVDDDPAFGSINFTQSAISSVALSTIVTGLSTSTIYYFRVRAINLGGNSAWSATSVGYSTTAATPTILVTSYAHNSTFGFGNVALGNFLDQTFTINNTGTAVMTLTSIVVSGTGFAIQGAIPTSVAIGGTTTFTVSFTPATINSFLGSVTINNNSANQTAYVINLTGSGTPSVLSTITTDTTYGYTNNILYANYQDTPAPTSAAISVGVHNIIITDGADVDTLPTILNAISFTYIGTANTIRTAALFTTSNSQVVVGTVGANSISFSGLSGANVTASDGFSTQLILRVTFNNVVTDNQKLVFTVSSATAAGSNTSSLFNSFGAVSDNNVNDRNRIEVVADRLSYNTQPSSTFINTVMSNVIVAGNDVNSNLDLDYAGTVVLTSTGTISGTLSASAVNGFATYSTIQFSNSGTFTITATTTGLGTNSILSNSFVISAITYLTGDYRTNPLFSGTIFFSSTTAVSGVRPWQRWNGSSWVDVTGTSATDAPENLSTKPDTIYIISGIYVDIAGGGTYNNIIIDFPLSTNYVSTASNVVGLTLATGKSLELKKGILDISGRFEMLGSSNLIVRNGTELYISSGTFLRSSGSTFTAEANSYIEVNGNWTNHSTTGIWNGAENFNGESFFVVTGWDKTQNFFNAATNITNNAVNSKFGYLDINLGTNGITGNWTFVFPSDNFKLTNKDFYITNSTSFNVSLNPGTMEIGGDFILYGTGNVQGRSQIGAKIFNIKGNFIKNGSGEFRLNTGTDVASPVELNVEGNFTVNGGYFVIDNGLTTNLISKVNLKGNLFKAIGSFMTNVNSNSENVTFNFTGNSLQTVDLNVGTSGDMLRYNFNIKSGATVQTINRDWRFADASRITVESGGTLDFGFLGTTALNLTETVSSANTNFILNSGGTLKITSVDGITTSGAVGNVQLDARTYTPALSTFHYIGKANQVTGNAITTSSNSKTIIAELNTNALILSLTNSTSITTPGLLNIKKGQVIETTTSYFTGSTGTLAMEDGTLYEIPVLSTSASDLIPRLDGVATPYNLSGSSTIKLSGSDGGNALDQYLRGARAYRNLTFSNAGVKTVSSAPTSITGNITVSDAATLNVFDKTMGGVGTNLIMTNTAQYITAGTGTKPDAQGTYSLGTNTKISFTNSLTALEEIRLTASGGLNYANIDVVGAAVGNSSLLTGINMLSTGTFTVKNGGNFKLFNTAGFTGSASTAINTITSPIVTLETGSKVEYAGENQVITQFSNTIVPTPTYTNVNSSYYNLIVSGSGIKTIPSASELLVGNDLDITSSSIVIDPNQILTVTNKVTTINDGIDIKNSGSLVQINDLAINSGNIKAQRTSRAMKIYDYTYWGCPVGGSISLPSIFDANYVWALSGEIDGAWAPFSGSAPGANGFITRFSDAASGIDFNFNGVPNNGFQTVTADSYDNGATLTATGNTVLLGNPYPSAINASSFVSDPANIGKIGGTLYFWTSNTLNNGNENYTIDDYASWNGSGSTAPSGGSISPNGNIASGQGFFGVLNADFAVTFKNSMRVRAISNNDLFFRSVNSRNDLQTQSTPERHRIWLNLTNQTDAFRQMLVGYIEGATNSYDDLYDGKTFTNNPTIIYSIGTDRDLVIQGRALPFVDSDTVSIGIKINTSGTYTIAIDHFDGLFENGQAIYLQDLLLGTINDLKLSSYTFYTESGTFNDRFILRYTDGTLNDPTSISSNNLCVIAKNHEIKLNSSIEAIQEITVFDILGRKINEIKKLNLNAIKIENLNVSDGVLILKIKLANGIMVSKKIIYSDN